MIKAWLGAIVAIAVVIGAPAEARTPLQQRVEARLAEAGPGVRFGLVVTDVAGRELIAISPDGRFIPASNTKIFTTAAAYDAIGALDTDDTAGGTSVWLVGPAKSPHVVLVGAGDPRLSSAPDCASDCLTALADAVAAKTKRVRDVVGDDTLFPDERWSPGMSWNNIPTRSGTGISALTVDDNELPLWVHASTVGAPPRLESLPYYRVDNRALTVASGETDLDFGRVPGSDLIRLTGTIVASAKPVMLRLGLDDPAHFAASRLEALLQARGVRVTGEVGVRHRPPETPTVGRHSAPLARLRPPPLTETVKTINKVSQNVYAELLIRRLGLRAGKGSIADGQKLVTAMLEKAGVPRTAYDLSDGSGMSTYNRVAPRGMVKLLRWIAAQPWGSAWRETLPIGGVDGTLSGRFKDTPLEGKVFAKTGTLNASAALSGYLIAQSGRTLIFSSFANDIPEGVAATAAVDAALLMIAAEN
jgi:D-alanyl-D-alanine carboxypeptidase/D-alanyl-D-alanine-endopeptidase (penicillin-binding protein 4)